MNQHINLRIILQDPPPGFDFGLQKGKGKNYSTVQTLRSLSGDLKFECSVNPKLNNTKSPDFSGPFVQGPPEARFIYIDIGTLAGQKNTLCSRRLKVPLSGISHEMVGQVIEKNELILETVVHGTGKDLGPNCGTVKPFDGWHVSKSKI